MKAARQTTAASLVVALFGCEGPLPIQYETEHLRIGTDFGHPLCQADLEVYEDLITRVEDELDVEAPKETTIYIWMHSAEAEWQDHCRNNNVFGCYFRSSNTAFTDAYAATHELGHAAMGKHNPPPLFGEGLADLYAGRQSQFGISAPTASMAGKAENIDLGTSSHFVRWLYEEFGPERLGQVVRAGRSKAFDLEPIYGMTFEQLEALYFETAPFLYTTIGHCEAPEITPAFSDTVWLETFQLDCQDSEDTFSAEIGLFTKRRFEIPAAGYYNVQIDGLWFELYRCSPNQIDAPFDIQGWLLDVPAYHTGMDGEYRLYTNEGPPRTLYFEAGPHIVKVGAEGHDDAEVGLAVWPTYGPHPAGSN